VKNDVLPVKDPLRRCFIGAGDFLCCRVERMAVWWNDFVFDTNVTKLCYQYKNTVIQNMQKTVDKYRTTCYIDITTG